MHAKDEDDLDDLEFNVMIKGKNASNQGEINFDPYLITKPKESSEPRKKQKRE